MIIKLVRHGQSAANTGEAVPQQVGDQGIPLTERGRQQARAAGEQLGGDFVRGALAYCSPYLRTRQTLDEICLGAGLEGGSSDVRVYEDPRLREMEHGYYDYESQQAEREVHGWFYYRYHGGESPADCYDRISGFLESLMRQVERKRSDSVLIVSHGLAIRCFAMRYLHLTVEQFEDLANPSNCDVVTIGPPEAVEKPLFTSARWAVSGLRMRSEDDVEN